MNWRIERHTGESDFEFAVRRFRLANVATGIALAVFASFWWFFSFSADQNTFVLFLSVMTTALAAAVSIGLVFALLICAASVAWYWGELRRPAMKEFRLRTERWGAWFSPLLLLGFSIYALFQLVTTGKISFFTKGTSIIVSGQEQPIVFVVLILFWVAVLLGAIAWLGYKLNGMKSGRSRSEK